MTAIQGVENIMQVTSFTAFWFLLTMLPVDYISVCSEESLILQKYQNVGEVEMTLF